MPVDSPHPLWTLRSPQWQRCRDAKAGTDAVKARGTAYLPQLGGQDWAEYEAYVRRAMFYPATERTVENLTGLILRKPAEVLVPEDVEAQMADLTLTGQSWESVLLEVLDEALTVGRLGILIEYPVENGVRPYWTLYRAEQIVNWRTGPVLGPDNIERIGLVRVVLREEYVRASSVDAFATTALPQYRVLELLDGIYTVTVWRKPEGDAAISGGGTWEVVEQHVPLRREQPVLAIPFVFIGARHARPAPDKPPLLDMVDVNLSHYRNSADLEHGRHWTALPTPYVTGLATQSTLKIGSATAWAIPEVNSKVGMLEFTGQGLAALEKALDHKERLMAIIGARMLEGKPMQNETAEAVRLRHSGDAATLSSLVCTVDESLSQAMRWHAWWLGSDDALTDDSVCDVSLNQDFFEPPMEPQMAQTLLTMWQAGGISWETYFYLLQRGEWTRPSADAEAERTLIQAEAAGGGLVPTMNGTGRGADGGAT